MADENIVLKSIESPDGGHCVDFFVRPDGSFGFEEYRRDSEDPRGWYPVGYYGDDIYPTKQAAQEAAAANVGWLKEVLGQQ